MKDVWINEGIEIEMLPEIKELWLKITGTIPTKRKYKTDYDTSNENDLKIIQLTVSMQENPYKEHETVYMKVTDNEKQLCINNNVLQNKEHIQRLWFLLHERLVNKIDHSCSICGCCMEGAIYVRGCGIIGLRGNNLNWTTCYNSSYVKDKGKYCHQIRTIMIRTLSILRRKIARLEKKNTCQYCKSIFNTTRNDTKFCSIKCRVYNHRKK